MYNPLSFAMLVMESQTVIQLRLAKLASGGPAACAEAQQIMSEKIFTTIEAAGMLMIGDSPDAVVTRYREHVAENKKRLTAEQHSAQSIDMDFID